MANIVNLLDEILCDIFSLVILNSCDFHEIFKSGNNFQDCVALIDISRVCRRWREIALTNPTLWSSLLILLHDPSAETLRQVTYFAEVCLARSQDLPLIFSVNISLDDFRPAHPLILSLVVHEARWSLVAFHFIRRTRSNVSQGYYKSHSLIPIRDQSGDYEVHLKNPGAGLLKEFYFNIVSWFMCSITKPIQGLETLRIAENVGNAVHSLAKWLPFAPNLTELEIMKDDSLFSVITEGDERQSGGSIRAFLLPKLRTLNAPLHLLPYLICPSLEKYAVDYDPFENTQPYLGIFVEHSACPLHTLVIEFSPSYHRTSLFDVDNVHEFLVPRITTLVIVRPGAGLIDVLSIPSEGGDGFRVLPALKHLEFKYFNENYFKHFSALITSRWDIPNARRSLKSVTLVRCFDFIPKFLSSPQSGAMIQMEEVEVEWRSLARCANEGLIFNVY